VIASTSGPEQTAIGVIIGLVVLGLPLLSRYLVRLGRDLHDIKDVLITPSPTKLVPKPAKGLIDTVADLQVTVQAGVAGVGALIRDSQPDAGTTSRDALNRIETEQDRLREVEDGPTQVP